MSSATFINPPRPGSVSTAPAGTARSEQWLSTGALSTVLVLGGAVCIGVAVTLLVVLDGWTYYWAPLATRGYMPQHETLRPSGTVGLSLGVAGVVAMLCTLPYALRKRWKALARLGTTSGWLETHIFFGLVGPVLVTFHTSFKFNGLISIAYWLMALVWSSGFVGRYLYVRIPKTIRGAEVSRAEVEARLAAVSATLATLPPSAAAEMALLERALSAAPGSTPGWLDLFFGELRIRLRLVAMRRQLSTSGVDIHTLQRTVALVTERAALARRLTHLERARRLFELWHVFHRPLVFGLFVIVAVHVGVAVFFGYARLAG
jgi:hypothetical protein